MGGCKGVEHSGTLNDMNIRRLFWLCASLITASVSPFASFRADAQTVATDKFMIQVVSEQKALPTGKPASIELFVMDASSMAAVAGLEISAKLSMPSMESMMLEGPKVSKGPKPGHYTISLRFPHHGEYRIELDMKSSDGGKSQASITLTPGDSAKTGMSHDHEMMSMRGTLGDWVANREGSGTSWQPDSSPMFMKMLPKSGRYELSLMGTVQTGFIDAGGKRGDSQLYANSMAMVMGRRETGGGTLGFGLMASLDALTNGKRGVPNLFQTGETAGGQPLVDRQHPHDLLAEASLSYSYPISKDARVFVYGGLVGEPALGNVMFLHRSSGMEIPEAPITHHWFDSTHISFGVATVGVTLSDKWKLEGSAFNGHEPDENRYAIDPIRLNSASGRVTYNPTKDLSLSTSYGYLKSPEALEPGLDQHRLTASAMYSRNFANGDNWSSSLMFGRLIVPGRKDSNAISLESTYFHRADSFFARYEGVDKDELVGIPAGSYRIGKFLLGDVRDISSKDGYDVGIGAYLGFYSFPSGLNAYYGKSPVTLGIFLRVKPSRM